MSPGSPEPVSPEPNVCPPRLRCVRSQPSESSSVKIVSPEEMEEMRLSGMMGTPMEPKE